MRRTPAFTLIELLVVVAIIGLLLSITLPSLAAVRESGKRTKCRHNLHQIGVAMEAFFGANGDIFPCIASLPSNEANVAEAEGFRKPYDPMAVVLEKETSGMTEVFECPSDVITDDSEDLWDIGLYPGNRYFDTETTSYEWNHLFLNPYYDSITEKCGPQKRRRLGGTGILADSIRVSLENLQMIYGFEPFHGSERTKGSINYLYADMHVGSK